MLRRPVLILLVLGAVNGDSILNAGSLGRSSHNNNDSKKFADEETKGDVFTAPYSEPGRSLAHDGEEFPILNMTYHGSTPGEDKGDDSSSSEPAVLNMTYHGDQHAEINSKVNSTPPESEQSAESTEAPTFVPATDSPTAQPTTLPPSPAPSEAVFVTPAPTDRPTLRPKPTRRATPPPTVRPTRQPSAASPSDSAFEGGNDMFDKPSKHKDAEREHVSDSSSKAEATTTIEGLEHQAEEIIEDRNVDIVATILIVVSILIMICVAQQMVENPDGCCARLCRCTVATCRAATNCCCCCGLSARAKERRTHDLIVPANGYDDYDHDLVLS